MFSHQSLILRSMFQCAAGYRLPNLRPFFFFLFQKYFSFCLPLSDWVAAMTWALQSRDFTLRAEGGGEEGRRGQRRSTPEAFLLLLKTERPSRPFWKTWMSLIQIQLPYSSGADGAQVDVVFFSTRFVTFLAGQTGFSDEFILTLIVGVCTVTRGVDVVRPRACPPSAGSCICPVPSHWVSDSERWGRPLGGNLGWKECELNAAGAELSQHQRHKHTVSGRTEGCKYRGEGRGGGRDVVCLVIWSWRQELWIRKCCDTPHEYATIFPWIAPEYTEHNGSWMLAYNNNDHICFEVRQSKDNNRRFWIDLLSA